MVAAFDVVVDTGGTDNSPGTSTVVTTIRYKRADNSTVDLNNPIVITAATTKYSRWKSAYLKCTTAPNTQVDNVRFYTDGTVFGTGVTVKAGDQFPVHNSGATTGYDVADTDDQALAGGHTDISSTTSIATYTSGSPLSGPSISEAGSIINATNETTNYLVTQMEVIDTASPGVLSAETYTFLYDEI